MLKKHLLEKIRNIKMTELTLLISWKQKKKYDSTRNNFIQLELDNN